METLLLQIALIFGAPACDDPRVFSDGEYYTAPAICEAVNSVWERVDSVADEMGWDWHDCDWIGTP